MFILKKVALKRIKGKGNERFVYHKEENDLKTYSFIIILSLFSPKIIPLHQSLIYAIQNCMANLNRLKLVLVEKDKTGKWLSEQLGNSKGVD